MSDLRDIIKSIQREVGAQPDGVFGSLTAGRVLRALRGEKEPAITELPELEGLDARSTKNILTLDVKAVPLFASFTRRANAVAATYGCSYILIAGNRSMEEQEALYAKGRTAPGKIVTNAKPGYSWHNLKAAGDYGVFRGGDYLDDVNPSLAAKVHAACSLLAAECGLEWGGSWKTFKDTPHYQVAGLKSSPDAAARKLFKEKGSVL